MFQDNAIMKILDFVLKLVSALFFKILSHEKSSPFEFQGRLYLFSVSPKCTFL